MHHPYIYKQILAYLITFTKSTMSEYKQIIREFFSWSEIFDHMVTRQLSHIKSNWELTWNEDPKESDDEKDSYAQKINELIMELCEINPPYRYHDHEDRLAEYCRDNLGWNINKEGRMWKGSDYASILEQGGFSDQAQKNLCLAVAGRVRAAINHKQIHFDNMESRHQVMLADVMAIILYHRSET
jgi:hypothetical protein